MINKGGKDKQANIVINVAGDIKILIVAMICATLIHNIIIESHRIRRYICHALMCMFLSYGIMDDNC